MLVSVVIPNWNGKELLKTCLDSLNKQTFQDMEVIIIDNGSVDGSVAFIQKNYPKFRFVPLFQNIGFAPAVNIGIKQAKGKYIVLINNDTEVDKRCIEFLVKAAKEHNDVGFIAAKMLNFYKREMVDSAGDYIDVVGHANNIGLGERDGEKFNIPGYVFLATGGGGLFKREVFEKVGLFDEDYFAYMEDVDICFRAQLVGFKGWFEPTAKIYHIHKATSSRNKALLEYLQFRNMTMTIIKDFPQTLLRKDFNWVKILLVNINTVRYQVSQGYGWSALRAEWYVLTHLKQLLEKRKQIQNAKTVDDAYIIESVRDRKLKIPFLGIWF